MIAVSILSSVNDKNQNICSHGNTINMYFLQNFRNKWEVLIDLLESLSKRRFWQHEQHE